jgi:hypothetical protein
MNIAHGDYLTGQTNLVLAPAHAGRAIRVIRLLVTCSVPVRVQLLTNPGTESVPIHSPLQVGLTGLHLALGRRDALASRPGEALGISTNPDGGTGQHSFIVWYEVA